MTLTVVSKVSSWTKWGGGRYALIKEILEEWYCQGCGRKQVEGLPAYMIPLDSGRDEFFRVCSRCKHLALEKKIDSYHQLVIVVRKRD